MFEIILNNNRIKNVLESYLCTSISSSKRIRSRIVSKCQAIDVHKGNCLSIKGDVGGSFERIDLADVEDIHFLGQQMDRYFTKPSELTIDQCKVGSNGINCLMAYKSIKYIQLLNLQSNNIAAAGLNTVTSSLRSMPLLNYLNLSNNRILDVYVYHSNPVGAVNITAFDEFMKCLPDTNIITLDLTHNYLGGIPLHINNRLLRENEDLYDQYQYDHLIIPIISSMLQSTKTLNSLKLHSNDFEYKEDLVQLLLSAIGDKNINLLDGIVFVSKDEGNGYHRLVAENICSFYARLLGQHILEKRVDILDFSCNLDLGDDELSSLFQGFSATKQLHLKELILHNTQVTIEGIKSLCSLITQKVITIEKLDVSRSRNLDDIAIKIIADHLKTDSTIKSLSIATCQVTIIGARHIADALVVNRTLKSLDISENDIQVAGFKRILDVLPVNGTVTSFLSACNSIDDGSHLLRSAAAWGLNKTNLVYFNAGRNPICGRRPTQTFEPATILALGECLELANSKIETLVLSHCDIGARSTRRLFEMLRVNKTLHTLEINECNINEQGGIHVGEILPEVVGLKVLLMNNCLIGPYGAEKLLLGLADNTSVEHIDISYNYLMGYNNNEYLLNSLLALQTVMQKNKTLKFIDMTGNNLFGLSRNTNPYDTEEFKPIGVLTLVEAINQCSHPTVFNILDRMKPKPDCAQSLLPNYNVACCPSSLAAFTFMALLNTNPNVKSLCGLQPNATVLNLANRYIDEHCVRVIANELAKNQKIRVLKANNYDLNEDCIHSLNAAIAQSVSLKAVEFPAYLRRDVAFSTGQKIVNCLKMDENLRISRSIYEAKRASLDLRLTLCLFSKKASRKNLPVRVIFEFLIGEVDAIHVLVNSFCRI